MSTAAQSKVQATHLARTAYIYVRQSSLRQVANNTESAERQYALRGRAVALGWPAERIVVIDADQGKSGATASERAGFGRLVSERSAWARPGSSLGSRSRGWRATPPTGTACWRSAR